MQLYIEKENKWVDFDQKWVENIPSIINGIYNEESYLFKYSLIKENGLYGYMQNNFEIILKPQFIEARPFTQECAVVFSEKWGIVDLGCKVLWVEEYFEKLDDFINSVGIISYYLEGEDPVTGRSSGQRLYGLIDTQGRIILECEYDFVKLAKNSKEFIEYSKDEGYVGLVSSTLGKVLAPRFSTFQFLNDQLIITNPGYNSEYYDARNGEFKKIDKETFYTLEKELRDPDFEDLPF